MKDASVEFVTSAAAFQGLPPEKLPEIALIGRSNVGKSSLLNALAGRRIAKTSATPGKTRLINFFIVNGRFYLVDLPGYGYAAGGSQNRAAWDSLVGGYIAKRPTLCATVILLDARHVLLPNDARAIEWYETFGKPYIVVLTKTDKLSQAEHARSVRAAKAIVQRRPLCRACILVSAQNGKGIAETLRAIAAVAHECETRQTP